MSEDNYDSTSKDKEICRVAEAKYSDYVGQVIDKIKSLPKDCCQSGDDSGLENVWQEYVSQVQGEQSIFYHMYEEVIISICREVIKPLPLHEKSLLWLCRDPLIIDIDEEIKDGIPHESQLSVDVEDELLRRVWGVAADENLG